MTYADSTFRNSGVQGRISSIQDLKVTGIDQIEQ